MGVYIKGMEMPTEGEYNLTLYVCSDGSAYIDAWSFPEESDKFLVVPIPPHGKCIDADALLGDLPVEYPSVVYAIETAPTIIPSEEGER